MALDIVLMHIGVPLSWDGMIAPPQDDSAFNAYIALVIVKRGYTGDDLSGITSYMDTSGPKFKYGISLVELMFERSVLRRLLPPCRKAEWW